MKRSQMLELLEQEINKGVYQDYLFDMDDINRILTKIEDLGMSPPEVGNILGKEQGRFWEAE